MKNNTVVVLGGAGLVGSLICRVLNQYGYHIKVVDRRPGSFGNEYCNLDVNDTSNDNGHIFRDAMAVIVALPEGVAVRAIPWVLKFVKPDVVIMPTCSVQVPFYVALKIISPSQKFIGVNPMFSPSLSFQGRMVAICMEDGNVTETFIERHLMAAGMKTRRLTPAAHDELMALCQSLPHAAILGFGMALANSSVDLALVEEVMPPPMRTMMALLSRLLVNSPEVYWDIQLENDQACRQREALLQGVERLMANVGSQNYECFKGDLQIISNALGKRLNAGAIDCQYIFSLLNSKPC
ncbi:prephenate dehydrogenase [Pseudomonas monteilii]|nr:prephenate dehydrogenase [Pseudomonas monteilii]